MAKGIEAPIVRVFFLGREISSQITSFKYTYSEEDDDVCTLSLETTDRAAPDRTEYQEKVTWQVQWGYIGGVTKTRKIYLQDIEWSFDKELIRADIKATDIAATIKQNTSKKSFKNTNLLSATVEVATKNGLNVIADRNKKPITTAPNKGEQNNIPLIYDEQMANLSLVDQRAIWKIQGMINNAMSVDGVSLESYYGPLSDLKMKNKVEVPMGIDKTYVDQMKGYKFYEYIPQANRTEAQILKDMAAREPGGPYVVETRDDNLIIRKRSFSSIPYKSYEYGGGLGELIDFKPASKNRNKAGTSLELGFGGWDKTNKKYFSGTAGPESHADPVLNKFTELVDKLEKLNPDQLRANSGEKDLMFHKTVGESFRRNVQPGESTSVFKIMKLPVTYGQQLEAAKETLKEGKQINDPTANNPTDAFAKASNLQKKGELQRNPANAKVIGDANIEVGMIITILNVSTKYSGNYYITKVDHTIDSNSGYITDIEMVRSGHNIKAFTNQVDNNQIKRKINDQVGDYTPSKEKISVKYKPNKK